MARKPRLDLSGFHHIFNRGVARSKICKSDKDKDKFLNILCKACKIYYVNVHDYCLMNNYYHLLIETTNENLSLFMRHVNAEYAIYFNRKYKRAGHLWRGRYNSWYIADSVYLNILFRYIEHMPIKAKITHTIGGYPYTLLATLLNAQLELIPCAAHSKLKTELNHEGMQKLLKTLLDKQELKELKTQQKKPAIQNEQRAVQIKMILLQDHFKDAKELTERNEAVMKALEDGYTQGEVARYVGLSAAMVSKIFTGLR